MKQKITPSKIKSFTKKEEIEFERFCIAKLRDEDIRRILCLKIRCCKCKEWKPLVRGIINGKESYMCRDCIMAIPITTKEDKVVEDEVN